VLDENPDGSNTSGNPSITDLIEGRLGRRRFLQGAAAAGLAGIADDFEPYPIRRSPSLGEWMLEKLAAEQQAWSNLSLSMPGVMKDLHRRFSATIGPLPLLTDPNGLYAYCFVTGSL